MAMIGRPSPPSRLSTGDIADNSITSAKIADNVITHADVAPNAITASELADDAVDIAALSATGTADNTTFLRGDNSWQIVDTEGTGIKSTGESGANKFLREDGDGTSSWQVAGSPSIDDGGNATAITIDSAEDVTFAKRALIPSLKPISNQNLTGTYSDHEMIIGDKFTLTGNLTINDNLVLASLSGSGQDITITDDGNGRTITTAGKVLSCTTTNTDATVTTASTADLRAGKGVTGTGIPAGATIASVTNATTFELSAAATASGTVNLTFDTGVFEAGEFLGTAGLPSLTDLTGTLANGVTGSPAINLENATFSAGTLTKTAHTPSSIATTGYLGTTSYTNNVGDVVNSGLEITIGSGNKALIIMTGWMMTRRSANANADRQINLYKEVSGTDTNLGVANLWGETEPTYARGTFSASTIDDTTGTVRYKLKVASIGTAGRMDYYTSMIVFEVKG